MRPPQVVPSLLAADLSKLGACLSAASRAGARWVSVDVMDGHFVPNLSFGPDHVRLVKSHGLFVDAHLMVSNPEAVAPAFAAAGADVVTFHVEASRDPRRLLRDLKTRGALAGMAVKPATPVARLLELLPELDLALVMTVEPGFGGAPFLKGTLDKVRALRRAIDASGRPCWLQVDGGINLATVAAAAAAGADSLVAGTAVFGAADIGKAFKAIRTLAAGSFGPAAKSRGTEIKP